MSALLLIKYDVQNVDFANLDKLAKTIVADGLRNDYAVSFNDSYASDFLQGKATNTIVVSDSFLYRQADELLDITEYVYEDEQVFKRKFAQKYSFLQCLAEKLLDFGARNIEIYFSTSDGCVASDYVCVETTANALTENLLDTFLKNAHQTGFTFPDMIIKIRCNAEACNG